MIFIKKVLNIKNVNLMLILILTIRKTIFSELFHIARATTSRCARVEFTVMRSDHVNNDQTTHAMKVKENTPVLENYWAM